MRAETPELEGALRHGLEWSVVVRVVPNGVWSTRPNEAELLVVVPVRNTYPALGTKRAASRVKGASWTCRTSADGADEQHHARRTGTPRTPGTAQTAGTRRSRAQQSTQQQNASDELGAKPRTRRTMRAASLAKRTGVGAAAVLVRNGEEQAINLEQQTSTGYSSSRLKQLAHSLPCSF